MVIVGNHTRTIDIRPRRTLRGAQLHRLLMAKISNFVAVLSSAATRRFRVHSLAHECASELYSCFQCIAALYSRGYTCPPDAGLAYETDSRGCLVKNKRTQARIQCMQRLHAEQPWASPQHLRLLLRGWEMAEEWYGRSRIAGSDVSACSYSAGNSMPPQATQQPSKCDPSSPDAQRGL
jgi:hypothetical protein